MCIRYEPAILNLEPELIFNDENYLVVNKPPGVIIHGSGGYYYNSLIILIEQCLGIKDPLYTVHRIDKGTSGVMIFAKKKELS